MEWRRGKYWPFFSFLPGYIYDLYVVVLRGRCESVGEGSEVGWGVWKMRLVGVYI